MRKVLWLIRKHKRVCASCLHIVVKKEKGKRKTAGMYSGTHTTFLLCFREERIKFGLFLVRKS